MDPISAVSVAGVALQLAGLCVSVPKALSKLKERYNAAPKTIRTIRSVCRTAELASQNISYWLSSGVVIETTTLAGLVEIRQEYSDAVRDIIEEASAIAGTASGDALGRGRRARVVMNQDRLQEQLQTLQRFTTHLHLLVDTVKLQVINEGVAFGKPQRCRAGTNFVTVR